ncbi:hypothetical protein WY02_16990 [Pseudonocardia sp. AL041005-10]|nr:hypothetical protein WY02_16990 [Pseudonocardia sp. AL041005-10]
MPPERVRVPQRPHQERHRERRRGAVRPARLRRGPDLPRDAGQCPDRLHRQPDEKAEALGCETKPAQRAEPPLHGADQVIHPGGEGEQGRRAHRGDQPEHDHQRPFRPEQPPLDRPEQRGQQHQCAQHRPDPVPRDPGDQVAGGDGQAQPAEHPRVLGEHRPDREGQHHEQRRPGGRPVQQAVTGRVDPQRGHEPQSLR